MSNKKTRVSWSKSRLTEMLADLTLVQKESWQWVLREGLDELITSISPVNDYTGNNWQILIKNIILGDPVIS
ncbi:MAG: hypothetical protein ABID04_03960, partial [Patescibacteria group bacterium]